MAANDHPVNRYDTPFASEFKVGKLAILPRPVERVRISRVQETRSMVVPHNVLRSPRRNHCSMA